jgi:cell volume regulation protein A
MVVPPTGGAARRQIVDLHLPRTALIVLVTRGEKYVVPRGGTVLEPGDSVLVLVEQNEIPEVGKILEGVPGETAAAE